MKRANQGFTLIEVMVALSIFALLASTVTIANIQSLKNSRMIEEQTEARWVNLNVLTQLRIEKILPKPGTSTQNVEFNGKDWEVEIETFAVEMELLGPFLRRVEIKASLGKDEQSADILMAVIGSAS